VVVPKRVAAVLAVLALLLAGCGAKPRGPVESPMTYPTSFDVYELGDGWSGKRELQVYSDNGHGVVHVSLKFGDGPPAGFLLVRSRQAGTDKLTLLRDLSRLGLVPEIPEPADQVAESQLPATPAPARTIQVTVGGQPEVFDYWTAGGEWVARGTHGRTTVILCGSNGFPMDTAVLRQVGDLNAYR
jgi:hypothetical protein